MITSTDYDKRERQWLLNGTITIPPKPSIPFHPSVKQQEKYSSQPHHENSAFMIGRPIPNICGFLGGEIVDP